MIWEILNLNLRVYKVLWKMDMAFKFSHIVLLEIWQCILLINTDRTLNLVSGQC